jgi:hypothetical protein
LGQLERDPVLASLVVVASQGCQLQSRRLNLKEHIGTISSSVVDPDPGSGNFLTPGSGMGKKSTIPDHISECLETVFWVKILEFLDADVDPRSGIFLSLDPG